MDKQVSSKSMRLSGFPKRLPGENMKPNQDLALEDFCRANFRSLVGMLSLWCGDAYLAQELAQETLARVCRDWSRVRRMDHPEAWARRVALNLANSSFRRRATERRALACSEQLRQGIQSDDGVSVELRALVASLPKRQRTAIVLRYYNDLSYGEIATVMEIPESTAKSLVARSVKRLRDSEFSKEEASDAR
jgi:RNA polymerase sigma factor (sigma-70 family)